MNRTRLRHAIFWLKESFSFTSSDGLSRTMRRRLAKRYEKASKLTEAQKDAVREWSEQRRREYSGS